jgi:hypothetical protein
MLVSVVCAMRRKFVHIIEALPELEAQYQQGPARRRSDGRATLSSGMGRRKRCHHEAGINFGVALGGR